MRSSKAPANLAILGKQPSHCNFHPLPSVEVSTDAQSIGGLSRSVVPTSGLIMKVVLKSTHTPDRFLSCLSSAADQVCKQHQLAGQPWNQDPEQNLVIADLLGASNLKLVFEKDPASKGIAVKFDSQDAERVNQIMGWLREIYASLFDERFEIE